MSLQRQRLAAMRLALVIPWLGLIGCGPSGTALEPMTESPAAPAAIRITPEQISLVVGSAEQLIVTVSDASGRVVETPLTWATSDPEVASVDAATGEVAAVGTGTALLTATAGSLRTTATVRVVEVPGSFAFTRIAVAGMSWTTSMLWYGAGRVSELVGPGSLGRLAEPAWSPDGSRLAVSRVYGDLHDGGSPEFASDIYLLNGATGLDQSTGIALTTDRVSRSPTWSPEGTRVAFVSGTPDHSHLYAVELRTGVRTRLTSVEGHYGRPRWSPDGQSLAFVLEQGQDSEIFVMRIDGSGLANVSRHPADDFSPNWSPDGTRLSFASERVGVCATGAQSCDFSDVFVVSPDGSGLTRLTFGRTGVWSDDATWSPDGSQIAFSVLTYFGGWNPDGRSGIYVMTPDGGDPVQVTRPPRGSGDTSPAWRR